MNKKYLLSVALVSILNCVNQGHAGFFSSKPKAADGVNRLLYLVRSENLVNTLSFINQEYVRLTKEVNSARKDIYEINKEEFISIRTKVKSLSDDIISLSQNEIRKLQIEKDKTNEQIKALEDGLGMWNAVNGVGALLANPNTPVGKIMTYVGDLGQRNRENDKNTVDELNLKIKQLENQSNAYKALVSQPDNKVFVNQAQINSNLQQIDKLIAQLKSLETLMGTLFITPEKALQQFAKGNGQNIDNIQRDLTTNLVAAKCSKVTSWTQSVSVDMITGKYTLSKDFLTCKSENIQLAQTHTAPACKSLVITSNNDAIEACIKAAK